MDLIEGIKHVDQALLKHSVVRFNYTILNPINRFEEFKKFENDPTYNPQFQYNSFDVDYHIEGLQKLKIPHSHPLGQLYEEIRDDLLIEAKALKNIGTSSFDVNGIFPNIDMRVVRVAKNILSQPKRPLEKKNKTVSDKDLAIQLKSALDKYGCRGWTIVFNAEASSRVSVSAGAKRVTIRKNEYFDQVDADRLIKHEIETHVLRSVNGESQPLQVCAIGLPHYLMTEEGLAMYNESQITPIPQEKFIRVARQVLVSYYASNLGFAQTYALVREYYRDNWTCFKSVLRSKRGLSDTSRPGGYIKDHCYLQGYIKIQDFIHSGGDIRTLYAGKISLSHSYLVRVGLLQQPRVLPTFIDSNHRLA